MQIECYEVGIPHDPLDFLDCAIRAGHPKDIKRHVGQAITDVLKENFHQPAHLLATKRIEFVKKYSALATSNKVEELKLRARMPEHIRKVMVGKRIALLGKMLEDLQFPDDNLVSDIVTGFKLSGWMPESKIFPRKVKNPTLTTDALVHSTASFNNKVWRQMQMRQDEQLENDTWAETAVELENGWIWEDPDQSWEGKVVARRFGIKQGSKTRVIDDCSVCGLNLTAGVHEKFQLHTIDQLCCMINSSFEMAQGTHCPILGRTYDLKHAYKQFGLCNFDRDLLRIAVQKPGCKVPTLVGLNSLPFGAVGSVAGFLRISFAIWWIGTFGLRLAWSAYFDDFSTLTRVELKRNADWAICSLFELIGLEYARDGPKCPPFAEIFKMLGLTLDLSLSSNCSFTVGHTADRKSELIQSLQHVILDGELTAKDAERLRGRLLFFESFVFGRVANLTLKQFGDLCRLGRTSSKLSPAEVEVVKRLLVRVETAQPIPLSVASLETWIVFTDGAVEGDEPSGSVGGVLIAPNHRIVHHFGSVAPKAVMDSLLRCSKHPIHELEMIPIFISFILWGRLMRGGQIVHYVDNESVRLALLKGSGETPTARRVADEIMSCELFFCTRSWYARVSSVSNLADDPSRGNFSLLDRLGSVLHEVEWEHVLSKCLS